MVIPSCIIEMREKVRFNQHPVITDLLWILGTESNLHVNDTYNNNNNNNNHFVDNDVQYIPLWHSLRCTMNYA